jgi:signal transduction histidine kinase
VVVTVDITEQKKREKELVETGKRLIEAQRIAKVGDWTWDLSNNALNWSDEMYKIFGLDKRSYTPSLEKYADLMHPDDRHMLLEVNYFDQINKESHMVEYRIIRGDNRETRYVLNTGESEFGPDGRPVFVRGTLQDITERKLMEIGLREAKTAAEEATRLKDKFVSLVSHDLKAPLSTMIGFVNLVRQYDNKTLGENEKMLLDRAQESGRQMLNLIEELLRISRFKSGRLKVEKQFFDAKYLGAAMIANYSPIATQKGVALEDLIPPYSRVYADRALMTEAVQNLVTNAIKFCKSGDRVTISLGDGDFASICVSDTGRGMSGEFLKDIFKYEKITSTTGTAGEKGTGLGLPLTKDIMEIHGGSVAVESRPGKGSRFCLKLPFARPKVLIADDDANFRQLQVWQLKTLNVEIIEAENGEEAFAKVVKEKPHLVITDIKMPVTDGLELLKKLKSEADTRDVPVIVVSGEYGMEFADQVFRLGGSDYVTKDKMTDADFLPRVRRFIS